MIAFPGRTSPIIPRLHRHQCHSLQLCDGVPIRYRTLCSLQDNCDYQPTVTRKEAKATTEKGKKTLLGFVHLIHW